MRESDEAVRGGVSEGVGEGVSEWVRELESERGSGFVGELMSQKVSELDTLACNIKKQQLPRCKLKSGKYISSYRTSHLGLVLMSKSNPYFMANGVHMQHDK